MYAHILCCMAVEQISLVLVKGASAMLVTAPLMHRHSSLAISSYLHVPLNAKIAKQGN